MTIATSVSESVLTAQVTHADGSVEDLGIIDYWALDPVKHAAGRALLQSAKTLIRLTSEVLPTPAKRHRARARQYFLRRLAEDGTWLALVEGPDETRAYLSPHPRVLGVEVPYLVIAPCWQRKWLERVPEWGTETYGDAGQVRVSYWTLSPTGRAQISAEGT